MNFLKGIAAFLITTIVGVVNYFYKPPTQPAVPVESGSVSLAPTPIHTPSSTSINPTEETVRPTPLPRRPMFGTTTTTPLTPIVDYLVNNLKSSLATNTMVTPPIATSSSPILNINLTTTTPIGTTTMFVPPVINTPPPSVPSPLPPLFSSVSSPTTQSSTPVSTTTVISPQLAALAGMPLSTPQSSLLLTTTGPEKLKIFNFAITDTAFTPYAIIVEKGDVAQLNVSSTITTTLSSKDLLFSMQINAGVSASVSMMATDVGTYVFYAQDANAQTTFGYFVVRPRT